MLCCYQTSATSRFRDGFERAETGAAERRLLCFAAARGWWLHAVVIVVDRHDRLGCPGSLRDCLNWVCGGLLLVQADGSGERIISRLVVQGLQVLTVAALVRQHQRVVGVVLSLNLAHVAVLVPAVTNHIETTPTAQMLGHLTIFVDGLSDALLSAEVRLGLVLRLFNQTVLHVLIRIIDRITSSAMPLEIAEQPALTPGLGILLIKVDLALIPCLLNPRLSINSRKGNILLLLRYDEVRYSPLFALLLVATFLLDLENIAILEHIRNESRLEFIVRLMLRNQVQHLLFLLVRLATRVLLVLFELDAP